MIEYITCGVAFCCAGEAWQSWQKKAAHEFIWWGTMALISVISSALIVVMDL